MQRVTTIGLVMALAMTLGCGSGDDATHFAQQIVTDDETLEDRTAQAMRELARGLATYPVDFDQFPESMEPNKKDKKLAEVDSVSFLGKTNPYEDPFQTALPQILKPYVKKTPTHDAWGQPLYVWSDGERLVIVSPGRDQTLDMRPTRVNLIAQRVEFDGLAKAAPIDCDDIVWVNRGFVQPARFRADGG